jgi:Family of unknown function (DUF6535)
MVFYLQQNVAMLAQISQQISSISPQFAIPSSPPPPYPAFSPSSSNLRVNVFWFMALIFSLSAALLAILVQKWVRDYMHVFQRYSDPLKSARLRQYLHEGCEKWYMPVVAEAVPGLLHISLFLFLVGLGDFILNINTTVGLCTIVPIGFSGLLYIFTMFASVIYPQSPYQNSFSALIWHLIQRLRGRTYKNQGPESASKPVSPNISERQMQLAMAESGERKKRDGRAIRWLVDSLTEEAEMELFVVAIPGSFNAEWGLEVWKGISKVNEDENPTANQREIAAAPSAETKIPTPTVQPPPRATTVGNLSGFIVRLTGMCTTNVSSTDVVAPARCIFNGPMPSVITSSQEENVVRELSRRVAQLLETCKNRGLFATDEQWRRRTRACVETTASLVGCANAELIWFGDVGRLLGDIGGVEKTGESFSTGMDRSFVIRWISLSIMAIRPMLGGDRLLQRMAGSIVSGIQSFQGEGVPDEQRLRGAEGIDDEFVRAWGCLLRLFWALFQGPNLTEQDMVEILRNHEFLITELERISVSANRLTWVDQGCTFLLRHMDQITHGITGQLPSAQKRFPTIGPIPFSQVLEFFEDPLKFPIIPPGQVLQSLCSLAPRFRSILEGQGDVEETRETLMSLRAIDRVINLATSPLQRQLWRLQDLLEGGGLGFIVELFFRALKQLLSTSLSQELQSALFIGTFREITSDWSLYKHSLGTQKILLDAVASEYGIFSDFNCPAYITDEFLKLLKNILDKQTGPHIDLALQQLENPPPWNYRGSLDFRANASNVIFQSSQI